MNLKGPQITKIILQEKKNYKVGGLAPLHFKTYYKSTVIKMVWYCHKDKHIDQWERIQNPEINPCTYDQMIFNKHAKTTQ